MQRRVTGTVAELLVAGELMRKGYDVYRALSPHAPCDLVATMGEVTMRVEVRTVTERADGTLGVAIRPVDQCDMYAFVCGDRIEFLSPEQAEDAKRYPRRKGQPLTDDEVATLRSGSAERKLRSVRKGR